MSGGGAAMMAGGNYQTTIATYLVSVILAERQHQLPEAFPRGRPTRIGAEQNWPIDDIALWSGPAIAWVQAKNNLDLGELRDAIAQFVSQFQHGRGRGYVPEALQADDRFVIAFDHGTHELVEQLPDVLDRLRHSENVEEITQGTEVARRVYDNLVDAVHRAGVTDEGVVREVLRRMRVYHAPSETLRDNTRTVLHDVVDDNDIAKADGVLYQHLEQVAERKTLRNRQALRAILLDAGFEVSAARAVRPDIERLQAETDRAIARERRSRTLGAAGEIHRERSATAVLLAALGQGNVIVTGEAGNGKSVVLLDAAELLREMDATVVYLSAEAELPVLASGSIEAVLEAWAQPGRPAYLFIDAMDALRLGTEVRRLRQLIEGLVDYPWRVVIASRAYDLQHSPGLEQLFPALEVVPNEFRDTRFRQFGHVVVGDLTDADLQWLREQSPQLEALFVSATPELITLLRNPFNLSIAAALVGTVDLHDVSTRSELLSRWWNHRIQSGGSLERENVVRDLARAMIAARRLRVPTATLHAGEAAEDLLSQSVLLRHGDNGETVAFRHAVIFDYAVERLLLAQDGGPGEVLGQNRDAFIFILPSLRSHFQRLFADPAHFFRELRVLFADGTQRATLLLVIAGIPVPLLKTADDISTLLDGDPLSLQAFRVLARTALRAHFSGMPLAGAKSGPWSEVAGAAATHLPAYFHEAALLIHEALGDDPTPEQRQFLAQGARDLLRHHLCEDDASIAWRARLVIQSFIRTFDDHPAEAQPLLERLLDPDRINRVGQHELQFLAYELKNLHDTLALELIYARLFSNVELPAGQVAMGSASVGLNFTQDSRQILEIARGELARRFTLYLTEAPDAAVRSMCIAVGATSWTQRYTHPLPVRFDDRDLDLIADGSQVWDSAVHQHDPWYIMAQAFERHLRSELDAGRMGFFSTTLAELQEHGPWLYLWRILIRNSARNEASARAILPLILQRAVLVAPELREPIAVYLRLGYQLLTPAERAELDRAILTIESEETRPEMMRYRSDLIGAYARAIPDDIDTTLADRRTILRAIDGVVVEASDAAAEGDESVSDDDGVDETGDDLILRGSVVRAFSIGEPRLSEDIAEAGASEELQASIDAASPYIHIKITGDIATLPAVIRRIVNAANGAPPEVAAGVLDVTAELVRVGLESKSLSDAEVTEFGPILFEAAAARTVEIDPEEEDDAFRWGSPAADIAAARALPRLFLRTCDDHVADLLIALTTHPRSPVRRHALEGLRALARTRLDDLWPAIERAAADRNLGIAYTAFALFEWLAKFDQERARAGQFCVFDRVARAPRHEVTLHLIRWLIDRAFEGNPEAAARLDAVLADPWPNPTFAELTAFELANRLAPGGQHGRQAVALLTPFVERLTEHLRAMQERHGTRLEAFPQPDRDNVTTSIKLLAKLGERVYHVGGTLTREDAGIFEDSGTIGLEHFGILRPLLVALANVPQTQPTYYVVKTLLGAISTAPADVLSIGTTALSVGITAGLAQDHTAEGDVRTFLLRYLTQQRAVLESDENALALFMNVVDAFAEAGWPSWIDVGFELDTIYRE